ncbi:MAG: 5'-methylthioadenosine/adenosylhomocysteine nucleosidase [Burkholderiaceae bacterium]|jgi:adenosylhomocysteine nucleosidase|nr:5'-methylthioadenosine/adenosylhomocysteine nucleosidase [Burkholderiaceae bacterium]
MPRIALISAMQQELSLVLQHMQHSPASAACQCVGGRNFWTGQLFGRDVVAVLCGIGKVSAATTATLLVERFAVQSLLFTGAAGGLGEGVAVGDVVIASALLQHDMDASPLFPRFEAPLYGRAQFCTNAALSDALAQAARSALAAPAAALGDNAVAEFALHRPQLHRGLVISGDRFVSTKLESDTLRQLLPQALAVEMEGAAVAQVCHDFGLPFAVMRTISDRADDTAHVNFMRFIDRVASRYSWAVLRALLARA